MLVYMFANATRVALKLYIDKKIFRHEHFNSNYKKNYTLIINSL